MRLLLSLRFQTDPIIVLPGTIPNLSDFPTYRELTCGIQSVSATAMLGKAQGKKARRHRSLANWTIVWVSAALTFTFLVVGISRTWVTAIMGTVGPFCLVVYAFRRHLMRWSFWAAFCICLAVHSVLVWFVVRYFMSGWNSVSIWLWLPVMCVEAFVLLIVVKRIEERFIGRRETMRLDF